MLKKYVFIIVLVMMFFGFIGVVSAASVTYNGVGDLVHLTGHVDEIYINGTINSDLVPILNAFKTVPAFKYSEYASSATIYASVSDELSTDLITSIASFAPAGATVVISSSNEHFSYTTFPYTMPSGFSVNFTNKIIHLPAGTTPADAVTLFNSIGVANIVAVGGDFTVNKANSKTTVNLPVGTSISDAVAVFGTVSSSTVISVGNDFNITAEGSKKTTTIHLNNGEDLADIFDIINNESLNGVIVAAPDYHVNLVGTETVIYLEGNLTEEQVLALVKDLNVNAIVKLINNDDFTVTLDQEKEPVINRNIKEKDEEKDETPKTGTVEYVYYVLPVLMISALGIIYIKRRQEQ